MHCFFCNYLDEEERAGCFVFIVFRMSCYCKRPVALPRGAWVGLQFVIVVFPDHIHLLFDARTKMKTIQTDKCFSNRKFTPTYRLSRVLHRHMHALKVQADLNGVSQVSR